MIDERLQSFIGLEELTLDDIALLFSGEEATTTNANFNQFVIGFWDYMSQVGEG